MKFLWRKFIQYSRGKLTGKVSPLVITARNGGQNKFVDTVLGDYSPVLHATSQHDHIVDLTLGAGKIETLRKVLLFAQPAPDLTGFLVRGESGSEMNKAVLRLEWWRQQEPYELLVAHSSKGSSVLQRAAWRHVFPRWVSYQSNLMAFVGSEKARLLWQQIVLGFIKVVRDCDSPSLAKARMEALYRREMTRLRDNFDSKSGDALNLMCLQQCLDGLVSSDEIDL